MILFFKRVFWTIMALISAIYAIIVGGAYLSLSPLITLIYYGISRKSFPVWTIFIYVLAPTMLAFDYFERTFNNNLE